MTMTMQRIAGPPTAAVLIAVRPRIRAAQGRACLPPRESGGRPAPATEEDPR
jgi:hypothetical protein